MSASERKTVLVVEDNQDIAQLVGQLLVAYGCEVVHARSLGEVMGLVADRRIDLLLLDILLPEEAEDGRKIALSLRQAGHKFPIYFMTGLRPPDVGKDYIGLADGFLRKPFSMRDLRRVLDEALGLSASGTASRSSAAQDVMGVMASIATEQEEIRRQQSRLATFMTVIQTGGGGCPSDEALGKFMEDSARYEEGLQRIEESLAEVLDMMRRHGKLMMGQQGRGV